MHEECRSTSYEGNTGGAGWQELLDNNSYRKGNISKLSADNTSTIKEQIVKPLDEFSEEKPEIYVVSKSVKEMTVSKRKKS